MKKTDVLKIYPWMLEKDLKKSELLIYAAIFGETKKGSEFNWSLNKISNSFRITVPTTIKALKELTEKGLIKKRTETCRGVKLCYYTAEREGC